MLIVTYNTQWGCGRDGRIDLERIAETVKHADVVALQEVERHWRPQAHPDQAERLGQELMARHADFYVKECQSTRGGGTAKTQSRPDEMLAFVSE